MSFGISVSRSRHPQLLAVYTSCGIIFVWVLNFSDLLVHNQFASSESKYEFSVDLNPIRVVNALSEKVESQRFRILQVFKTHQFIVFLQNGSPELQYFKDHILKISSRIWQTKHTYMGYGFWQIIFCSDLLTFKNEFDIYTHKRHRKARKKYKNNRGSEKPTETNPEKEIRWLMGERKNLGKTSKRKRNEKDQN